MTRTHIANINFTYGITHRFLPTKNRECLTSQPCIPRRGSRNKYYLASRALAFVSKLKNTGITFILFFFPLLRTDEKYFNELIRTNYALFYKTRKRIFLAYKLLALNVYHKYSTYCSSLCNEKY